MPISSQKGFPHYGDALISSGGLSIEGTNGTAYFRLKYLGDLDGSINPTFTWGPLVSGGVSLPMLSLNYLDNSTASRPVFIVESSGTVASVSDGTRRSHYEAFLEDGDVDPLLRLSSSPYTTLEMGPGGSAVIAGNLVRASNVTTATCSVPHLLAVGSTFHMSHSEALFPAFTASTKTVASVVSPTVFTYADTGTDGSSTISHYITGTTDIHFKRSAALNAALAIGGGTKTTWYPDSFVTESGIDLKALGAATDPLFWASSGYARVGISVPTPSAKLHVKGTAAAETVSIVQGATSQSGYLQEWQNSSGTALAYLNSSGIARFPEISSSLTSVSPISASTGRDVYYNGDVRRGYYKVAVSDAGWTKPAATTEDLTILTLPAKARVTSVIADTLYSYYIDGASTVNLRVGVTTGGQEWILDHDVSTSAVTKGLADADLGTSINRANAVQGGHIPNWTTTTAVKARLTSSSANLTGLVAGQTFYYITVEFL